MFRDTIELETEKCRQSLYDGKSVKFKIKNSIPHDLGDPGKLFVFFYSLLIKNVFFLRNSFKIQISLRKVII